MFCPYCAEEIKDAAIVCKHCGRDVVAAEVTNVIEVARPSVVSRVMSVVIGVGVIGCSIPAYVVAFPLGIIGTIAGIAILALGNAPKYEACPKCGGSKALRIEKEMTEVTCGKCSENFNITWMYRDVDGNLSVENERASDSNV